MSSPVDNVGSLPHRALLALVWACFSSAFLFVTLRTVIRFKVSNRLTPEDYWMFLALATLLTLCILETIQLPSLYFITAEIAGAIPLSLEIITYTEDYLRYEFPIIILFWTVLWCVKAGFLSLYYKLFRELPIYRRAWYILAAFTLVAYAGCIVTLCMSCHPISNFFKFNQCGAASDVWASNLSVYYSTVVDVFTDVCIMAMPLRLIYNVRISLKQKAGLVCVFGLGFVMIAFAIIRAKQVLVPQYFVNTTLLMVWSTLAATISVIVGSLPALKLLIANRATVKRTRYGSSAGRGKQGASNNNSVRSKSVPLGSLSSHKSSAGRLQDAGESQEDILKSDGAQFVIVKQDVSVTYDTVDRPHPSYHSQMRQPPPSYENAI